MKPQTKRLECPNCSATGEKQMYSRLCISKHAEKKEDILSGTFFEWECPGCGKRYFIEDVFLYNDDKNGFMVYLVSGYNKRIQPVPSVIKTDVKYDTENSTLRITQSYVDFVEKIRILEAGLDDRAIETVKAIYTQVYSQDSGQSIYQMIFEEVTGDNTLRFAVFLKDNDFTVHIPMDAYEQTSRDFIPLLTLPSENEFVMIDQSWLMQSLKNGELTRVGD